MYLPRIHCIKFKESQRHNFPIYSLLLFLCLVMQSKVLLETESSIQKGYKRAIIIYNKNMNKGQL